jgi:hypothetical protein
MRTFQNVMRERRSETAAKRGKIAFDEEVISDAAR